MSHKFETISEGVEWCSRCGMVKKGDEYHIVGIKATQDEHRKTSCWMHPNATLQALYKWIEIREEIGQGYPKSYTSLRIDLDHSALFQRLLAKEEIFPEPPPRAYSYPWYSLIETGQGYPREVWVPKNDMFGEDTIVIDQNSSWKILETISTEEDHQEWIVAYEVPDVKLMKDSARAAHKSLEDWIDTQQKEARAKGDSWYVPTRLSDSRWRVKHIGSPVYFYKGVMNRGKHNNGEWEKLWSLSREPDSAKTSLALPQSPSSATE